MGEFDMKATYIRGPTIVDFTILLCVAICPEAAERQWQDEDPQ